MRHKRIDEDEPEVRVTDRRRIYLNDDLPERAQERVEEPQLKPTYVEELEARTKAAENQVREVQTRFEQLRAQLLRETDETRQRLNRAAEERAQQKNADFIAALLPVLDNLQRATEAASAPSDSLLEGLRRTIEGFESALLAAGVEPIATVGQAFDPAVHEAVDTVFAGPEMEGKVVEEYTRGYKMGDRLLRPSRVSVGIASPAKSDTAVP